MKRRLLVALVACASFGVAVGAISVPTRSKAGIVASQNEIASKIGADVIRDGGTAVDAAVAAAFALAVTHPTAGNIGGGGFMVYRPASGDRWRTTSARRRPPKASADDVADRAASTTRELHHNSHLAVGVPGTVAGLHLAWKEQGKLPWRRLVDPAIALARDGFVVSDGLARSLNGVQRQMAKYPGVGGAVLEERRAVRGRRDAEAAGPGADARAHRRRRGRPGSTKARRRALIEKEMQATAASSPATT